MTPSRPMAGAPAPLLFLLIHLMIAAGSLPALDLQAWLKTSRESFAQVPEQTRTEAGMEIRDTTILGLPQVRLDWAWQGQVRNVDHSGAPSPDSARFQGAILEADLAVEPLEAVLVIHGGKRFIAPSLGFSFKALETALLSDGYQAPLLAGFECFLPSVNLAVWYLPQWSWPEHGDHLAHFLSTEKDETVLYGQVSWTIDLWDFQVLAYGTPDIVHEGASVETQVGDSITVRAEALLGHRWSEPRDFNLRSMAGITWALDPDTSLMGEYGHDAGSTQNHTVFIRFSRSLGPDQELESWVRYYPPDARGLWHAALAWTMDAVECRVHLTQVFKDQEPWPENPWRSSVGLELRVRP